MKKLALLFLALFVLVASPLVNVRADDSLDSAWTTADNDTDTDSDTTDPYPIPEDDETTDEESSED
jgi:hypothetical protein